MYVANTPFIPWADVIGYVHEVQGTFLVDWKFLGIEMSSCKPADRTDNLCDVITHTETITERWMSFFNETCKWRAKPISWSTDHRLICRSLGGVAKKWMNVWGRSADRETKDKRNRDEAEHNPFIRNTDLFLRLLPFLVSFASSFLLSSSSFSILRPLCSMRTCIPPSERINPLSSFHETSYGRHAALRHPSAPFYNFLQSTGTQICEVG